MPSETQASGDNARDARGVDEDTPLLSGQQAAPTASLLTTESPSSTKPTGSTDAPLPKIQLMFLCYARMIEPIAFFSIFPFINQMIQDNGQLAAADVGFYSGLIESLFSLTQMVVMIGWGRAADRIGRKPVLVVSLAGMTAFSAGFGFARTIWQMILLRCLAGVFAGSTVTIRAMISEHSNAKTQARAFSWFAFAGNVGLFLGPLLGGAFADPAKQYGGIFAKGQFFKDFPYALATMVTGIVGASAVLASVFFIEETLTVSEDRGAKTEPPQSTRQILQSHGVKRVLGLYGYIMLLAFAYTAVAPVFWFTPIPISGFGFSELQISLFMALAGASQAVWLLLIFPPLQHRFGTGGVLRGCANAYPIFFVVPPLLNLLLREGSEGVQIAFWIISPIILALGSGVSMAFTAIQLALNDVSPSPQTLGTLNALALAMVSGIRAFAPVLFNSIFAWSVKYQILQGYLIWLILVILASGYTLGVRWLPKNAEGMPVIEESEEHA